MSEERRVYEAWVMPPRDPVTFSQRSYPIGYFTSKEKAIAAASQPVDWAPEGSIYGYDSIPLK